MEKNQESKSTDANTKFRTYATNFGFANSDEFFQFLWFREALDPNGFDLCHNFFIYDPRYEVFREIDFGIISRKLFVLVEHKHGKHKAIEIMPSWDGIYNIAVSFFRDQGIFKLPQIVGVVITKDDDHNYIRKDRPVVINSEEDTKLFYDDVVLRKHVKSDKTVPNDIIRKILDVLNCKPYEYRQITSSIFDIFEKTFDQEKGNDPLTIQEQYRLTGNIYNNFSPLNYLLSNIFLSFENEQKREMDETEKCDQLFCLHQMSPSDIISNMYPIYWVCITQSQGKDYPKEFQLGFHISDKEWYIKGKVGTHERKHFTIKLAFFRGIRKRSLSKSDSSLKSFQERLKIEKIEFKDLLLSLNKDDDKIKFQFFRTIKDRFDVEVNPIDSKNCDRFIDNIIAYDNGEMAIARSTEIVKIFDWDESIRCSLETKAGAEKLLKSEYNKLIDLYKFMTGANF